MINQLAHSQQQFVRKIFTYVSEGNYTKAENEVYGICSKILQGIEHIKDKGSYLLMIDVLYSEFNDYYAKWMKEQSKDLSIQEGSKNIFIEHSGDPVKMEDLLWETADALTSGNTVFA